MNLTSKPRAQINADKVERAGNTALLAAAAAVSALNNAHKVFWSHSEEELAELLQHLLDAGELVNVFERHLLAATGLNEILDANGYTGRRAVTAAGREFEVTPEGVLTLVPLPVPEPKIIPEPDLSETDP